MPLPSGTVTLLFTDVESSTALVQRLRSAWPTVRNDHLETLRNAVREAGGEVIDERGEELLAAFGTAKQAVEAAVAAQRAHLQHPWPEGGQVRVRMGIHTGEPTLGDSGYLGLDVHRTARLCALAHGGQVLLSATTNELVHDHVTRDLGEVTLRGLTRSEHIYQLVTPGLPSDFPPIRQPEAAFPIEGRERELAAAAAATVGRSLLPRIRNKRAPGLAELGWEARAAVPSADPDGLPALSQELFVASRSAAAADFFLAGVSRRALAQHVEAHRRAHGYTERALNEAEHAAARLRQFDALVERRAALDGVALAVAHRLADPASHAELLRLARRAVSELDAALESARADIEPHAVRLRRTRSRGVFRQGYAYVVPFIDDDGVPRRRRFDSASAARTFRRTIAAARGETPIDSNRAFASALLHHWERGSLDAAKLRSRRD